MSGSVGVPVWVPWFGLLLVSIAPFAVGLLQVAFSRTREYQADLEAARLTGDPAGLASALESIRGLHDGWLSRWMWPKSKPDSLMATHPPTEERIRRLRSLMTKEVAWVQTPASSSLQLAGLPPTIRSPRGWF